MAHVNDTRCLFIVQASAIDTHLKAPQKGVRLMTSSKPDWLPLNFPSADSDNFEEFLDMSEEDWHKKHGLYVE